MWPRLHLRVQYFGRNAIVTAYRPVARISRWRSRTRARRAADCHRSTRRRAPSRTSAHSTYSHSYSTVSATRARGVGGGGEANAQESTCDCLRGECLLSYSGRAAECAPRESRAGLALQNVSVERCARFVGREGGVEYRQVEARVDLEVADTPAAPRRAAVREALAHRRVHRVVACAQCTRVRRSPTSIRPKRVASGSRSRSRTPDATAAAAAARVSLTRGGFRTSNTVLAAVATRTHVRCN